MRLGSYLNEDKKNGIGITFVDLDETLFNTFAKINVLDKNGNVIKSLTNSEFNAYNKKDGETFDFDEFRDSKLFYDTSVPIEPMIKRITRIIRHTESKGSRVIILTARRDLDNKHLFLSKFRKEGFPIDKVYVERAGNISGGGGIPVIKKKIILGYLNSGLYRRVRIFDDHLPNCKAFIELKDELPVDTLNKIIERYDLEDEPMEDIIRFESYHVLENGSVKEIM
jgi:hypothetical protein